MILRGQKILVAVTGGIAAYKACELVRQLIKQDAEVRVMMTQNATEFVSKLTFEALTQHEVAVDMWEKRSFTATRHIDWADWPDAVIVAPASANFIAKLAHGMADDLLSTTMTAVQAPVVIAPAMNMNMLMHPPVVKNINCLVDFGYIVTGTSHGDLACGWTGQGRLIDPPQLVEYVRLAITEKTLQNKKVLITSGPTAEDIDPVRYITNRSTGKMGAALALAAWCKGADVTVISGPVNLAYPLTAEVVDVRSAKQMTEAVQSRIEHADIYISAAAIADFTPVQTAVDKLKKGDSDSLDLKLVRTTDILASLPDVAGQKRLGFAVETRDMADHGSDKLKRKGLDLIFVNNPKEAGAAFGSDTNHGMLIRPDGEVETIASQSKLELANHLLDML